MGLSNAAAQEGGRSSPQRLLEQLGARIGRLEVRDAPPASSPSAPPLPAATLAWPLPPPPGGAPCPEPDYTMLFDDACGGGGARTPPGPERPRAGDGEAAWAAHAAALEAHCERLAAELVTLRDAHFVTLGRSMQLGGDLARVRAELADSRRRADALADSVAELAGRLERRMRQRPAAPPAAPTAAPTAAAPAAAQRSPLAAAASAPSSCGGGAPLEPAADLDESLRRLGELVGVAQPAVA